MRLGGVDKKKGFEKEEEISEIKKNKMKTYFNSQNNCTLIMQILSAWISFLIF